jgi:hypothetical protein
MVAEHHTHLNKLIPMKRSLNTLFAGDEVRMSPEVLDQVTSFNHTVLFMFFIVGYELCELLAKF